MSIIGQIKKRKYQLINPIKKLIANDNNIYLIYTMGKVGSTTIYKSLKRKKLYSDVFHTHFLSKNYLEIILPRLHRNFHRNIPIGKKILSHIEKNNKSRIKIITLTREPIERAISDLFENWKHLYDNIEDVPNNILKAHIESLHFNYTLSWFDEEFKEYLNFDIFDKYFDPYKGYEIYNHENYDILCIKLEKLNSISKKAFMDFLGDDIPLVLSNTSENKIGKEAHKFLKMNVCLEVNRLIEIYNSKYVRHFYSTEEIDGFIKKWRKTQFHEV